MTSTLSLQKQHRSVKNAGGSNVKRKTRKISGGLLTDLIAQDAFIRRMFGISTEADIREVVLIPTSGGSYEVTIAYN